MVPPAKTDGVAMGFTGRLRRKKGFRFTFDESACSTCSGRCCTGASGYIWATIDEIEAIAAHQDMHISQFIKKYTYRENGRFSISEVQLSKDNYACVFFDGQCTIYDVRPEQCRTYPFWPHFKKKTRELLRECPGVQLDGKSKNRKMD
jgi:uncharacterized protein